MRAQFDGKVLVPCDPVELDEGRVYNIQVEATPDHPRGSPAALLSAMHEPPHLANDEVDELERLIEEGKLPVNFAGPFDEETE